MAGAWRAGSEQGNFLTLDAVPIDKWTAAEVRLLERALAAKASAAPEASIRNIVDDILSQIQVQCSSSGVGALRLALCVLLHGRPGPTTFWALELIEEARNDFWLLQEEQQIGLHGHLQTILGFGGQWAERAEKLLEFVKSQEFFSSITRQEFTFSPGEHAPLRALGSPSGRSASLPGLRLRSPASRGSPVSGQVRRQGPKRIESVYEREIIPKDPSGKQLTWWRARTVPWFRGQAAFPGQQFTVPSPSFRPVGRHYFEDYQRCHPSNF